MIDDVLRATCEAERIEPDLLDAWFTTSGLAGPDGASRRSKWAIREVANEFHLKERSVELRIQRFRAGIIEQLADRSREELLALATSLKQDTGVRQFRRFELAMATAAVAADDCGLIRLLDPKRFKCVSTSKSITDVRASARKTPDTHLAIYSCSLALLAAGHAIMTGWLGVHSTHKENALAIAPKLNKKLKSYHPATAWPALVGLELLPPRDDQAIAILDAEVGATPQGKPPVLEARIFGNMTIAHAYKQRATRRQKQPIDRRRYLRLAESYARRTGQIDLGIAQFLENLRFVQGPVKGRYSRRLAGVRGPIWDDLVVQRALNHVEAAVFLEDYGTALDLLSAVDSHIREDYRPAHARAARLRASACLGLRACPPSVLEQARECCRHFPYDLYLLGEAEAQQGQIRRLYQV